MRKLRGFRIGRKVLGLWSWIVKPKQRSPSGFIRLNHEDRIKPKTITKICSWGHCLTKRLCFSRRRSSDYSRVGQTSFDAKPVAVPKGHLAVYVGQKDNDPHRFLVPVIYFNHPLFGGLLRQAEREYGFNHTGGINLPCQISEFESVQMMIAAAERRRKVTRKRRSLLGGF
ncbi:auxin-responsive protein SAUR36-like [Magnolia sinica]|uniref:auxin-responsive protein SAUR36-like n=1 Tax=Magnolia sinica TaxID=86752 RepID=UPI002657D1BA|nr:auxin-responsive protein SAUR36-like [Magnolia sinica]